MNDCHRNEFIPLEFIIDDRRWDRTSQKKNPKSRRWVYNENLAQNQINFFSWLDFILLRFDSQFANIPCFGNCRFFLPLLSLKTIDKMQAYFRRRHVDVVFHFSPFFIHINLTNRSKLDIVFVSLFAKRKETETGKKVSEHWKLNFMDVCALVICCAMWLSSMFATTFKQAPLCVSVAFISIRHIHLFDILFVQMRHINHKLLLFLLLSLHEQHDESNARNKKSK